MVFDHVIMIFDNIYLMIYLVISNLYSLSTNVIKNLYLSTGFFTQSHNENPIICFESSSRQTCLTDLPEDVFIEVLLRLPVKSLLRFKVVCKAWRSHISNPKFIKRHNVSTTTNPKNDYFIAGNGCISSDYDKFFVIKTNPPHRAISLNLPSSISHNKFDVVGSCNGLLCIDYKRSTEREWKLLTKKLYLWNPATGKVKDLPRYKINTSEHYTDSLEFGFDFSSSDYKVVRIVREYGTSVNRVEVYSLKNNSWKEIEVELDSNVYFLPSALVKGSLYWLKRSGGSLLSFNLQNENFHTISSSLPDKTDARKIFEFRESVAVTDVYHEEVINIWTLDDDKCWIKQLTINRTVIGELDGCLKTGEFVGIKSANELVLYDPVNEVGKTIQHRMHTSYIHTYNYSESLVNLN